MNVALRRAVKRRLEGLVSANLFESKVLPSVPLQEDDEACDQEGQKRDEAEKEEIQKDRQDPDEFGGPGPKQER